jgi:glycosyltransferase involved in cell wall biosynthesis
VSLSGVDLSYHDYPYELIFKGAYEDVPLYQRIIKLFWLTWTTKADFVVIAGYDKMEYWAQMLALVIRGKRRGVFCDSTALDRSYSMIKYILKRIYFNKCDLIFCYGERSRQYIIAHGVGHGKIIIRCQAAALSHDYYGLDIISCRASQISKNPQILYVGRLSQEKNLTVLLDAFARCRQRHPLATLRFVGDGPDRQSLEAKVRDSGLADAVLFVGSKNQDVLANEYFSSTCLVLPSLSEPWGLVVNEALSYGCPVVVSRNCGCVPELVIDSLTGFVFDPTDAEELSEKLDLVLAEFTDTTAVARACLGRISAFTPKAAAEQILTGCVDAIQRGAGFEVAGWKEIE